MAELKIYYALNEEGRRKSLASGGDGKEIQVVTKQNPTLEDLKYATVNIAGEAYILFGIERKDYSGIGMKEFCKIVNEDVYKLTSNKISKYDEPRISYEYKVRKFSEIQTADQLIKNYNEIMKFFKDYEAECLDKLKELIRVYRKVYKEHDRLEETRKAAERAAKEVETERRKERAEKLEKEKRSWILELGSEFLKKACWDNNYNCQRRYVTERAAIEFPGFIVDFDDILNYTERSCPSELALDESIAINKSHNDYNSRVVWIKSIEDDYYFEECEGIVIEGYLDKYTLYKIME